MSQEPVVRLSVGAEGDSGELIIKEVQKQLNQLTGKNPLPLKVGLHTDTKKHLQDQLRNIKGLTIDVTANVTGVSQKKNGGRGKPSGGANKSKPQYPTIDRLHRANLSAVAQDNLFSSYLKTVPSGALSKYRAQIDEIRKGYLSAKQSGNSNAIKDLVEANAQMKQLKSTIDMLDTSKLSSANMSAVTKQNQFSAYLKTLSPETLTQYESKIRDIQDLLSKASLPSNHDAVQDLKKATDQAKMLKSEFKSIDKYAGADALHKTNMNAATQNSQLQAFLDSLDPNLVKQYQTRVDSVKKLLTSASSPSNSGADKALAEAKLQEKQLRALLKLSDDSKQKLTNMSAVTQDNKLVSYLNSLSGMDLEKYKSEIQEIHSLFQSASKSGNAQAANELSEAKKRVAQLKSTIDMLDTSKQKLSAISVDIQQKKFDRYTDSLKPSVLQQYRKEIEQINDLLRRAKTGHVGDVSKNLKEADLRIKDLKASIRSLGEDGGSTMDHLVGKFKTFSTYLVSSAATLALVGSFTKAIKVTYDLNDALTDLRIVTGGTKEDAAALISTYNQMAQAMGTTTKEVSSAAVEWLRQGYSMADTQKLIEDSMVLSTVGFMDSNEAAQALTSTMKGYRLSVEDAIGAVDKFTAVDMAAATSAGNIAIALSKTAANAKLAGISLNDVVGQLALVNETMQEAPESTGVFYNTMLSRMGMIKSGRLSDPETGESLSDVETTLKSLGINLRDSSDTFRNFGMVLDEVGGKWDNYSNVQQRAIATAFAGTRQQTRFIALMEGWDQAAEYSKIAAESTGTAMSKFAIYQESLAAKTQKVTASFERLTTVLVDSDVVGIFLDLGSSALNFLADVGSMGDGAVASLTEVTLATIALYTTMKMVRDSTFAKHLLDSFGPLKDTATAMKASFTAYTTGAAAATTQTTLLTGSLKGAGAAMMTFAKLHPVLSAIAAITALVAVVDACTTSLSEQREITDELRGEYTGLAQEVKSLNDELATTKSRIEELEGKGTLSITEAGELEKLKGQNEELERQIRIKERLARQAANELAESVRSEADKTTFSVERNGESYAAQRFLDEEVNANGISGKIVRADEAIPEYIKEIERLEGYLAELDERYDAGSVSEELYGKYSDALRNDIATTQSAMDTAVGQLSQWYSDMEGATGSENTDFASVLSAALDTYDNFTREIEQDGKKFSDVWKMPELSGAVQLLSKMAEAGRVTAKSLSDPAFAKFVQELTDAGLVGGDTGMTLENVAAEINNLASETQDAADEFVNLGGKAYTLDAALGQVVDRYELLASTQKEFAKNGSISADTLTKILQSFGEGSTVDLTQNVSEYILGLKSASELLQDLSNAYQVDESNFEELMRTKLYASESFYAALSKNQKGTINEFVKTYDVDLDNFKTVESAKLKIQAAIIQKMLGNLSKYSGMSYEQLKAEQSKLGELLDNSAIPTPVRPDMGGVSIPFQSGINLQSYLPTGAVNQYQKDYDAITKALNEIDRVNREIDEAVGEIDFNPASFDKATTGSGSGKGSEVELYVVQIDAAREALQRLEEVTARINQSEARLDLIPADEELRRQEAMVDLIGQYGEKMKAIENLNTGRIQAILKIVNQLRSVGFEVDYDWKNHSFFVENLEHLNELGANLDIKSRNKLIKQYEQLIEKAEEYNQANIDGALEYVNIQKQINDLQEQYLDIWKERLNVTKGNLDSILDLVKDMIKQESEDMIDALEDQSDAYKEIIEMKKRSLELTEKERDYQKGVQDRTEKIRKLQERIDALSMDDSREAQLEKQKLLEELAKLQEELTEYQHDHSIESQKDALDKDLENYEDNIDDKIAEIEKFLHDQGKLTEEAYDRIDREGDALFDNLLDYALKYTDTTRTELEKMWEDALSAAKEYGSFVDAMNGVTGELGDMENGSITPGSNTWNKILNQMKELGSQWGSASEAQRELIAAQSLKLGTSIGATRDENGVWWYRGEKLFGGKYDTTAGGGSSSVGSSSDGSSGGVPKPGSSEFERIIARMRELGSQYGDASPEKRKQLAAESLRLGTSIGAVRDNDGVWWYKGKKLFDVYHTGGEIGSIRPKSNEVFALMERGEVVMNAAQQSRIIPMLQESVSMRNLISLLDRQSNNDPSPVQSVSVIDNTTVTVADGAAFRQYLSENRRSVANLVATELAK